MDSRENLELTVSAFSGVKGNYVIRWKDVPDIFQLTMHDRALQEEIFKRNSCLPPDVRMATLETARTGLAGPEAQRSAEEAITEEENEILLTRYYLFKSALEKLSGGQMTLHVSDFTSTAGRDRIRSGLGEIAKKFGTNANELYDRLERWGQFIAPLGMPGMPKDSRLRRLIGGITNLGQSLNHWADTDKSEAADLARGIAKVAYFTEDFARDLAAAAVRPVEYAERVLSNWEKATEALQRDIGRLWWTVDGWEFILLLWKDAEGQDRDHQRMRPRGLQRLEESRVIDGVVAHVLVELGGRLRRAGFNLDLGFEHRLVGLEAVDEHRQLIAPEVGDQLETLGAGLHARRGAGAACRRRGSVQVFAIGAMGAGRSPGTRAGKNQQEGHRGAGQPLLPAIGPRATSGKG
ncbi:MAG: hypothetical protein OJJ21_04940 [Ferrovibrio sp.]|uniref:hypothetical protein n=1 Tax=Ferrovibrio sp. TaxID=1917215 RepID=UPI002619FB03|nr:hypothetical protein [Ferrovibrio sp.]MCW0232926.1 hypothetical protein [Ferrovibrio sp.]